MSAALRRAGSRYRPRSLAEVDVKCPRARLRRESPHSSHPEVAPLDLMRSRPWHGLGCSCHAVVTWASRAGCSAGFPRVQPPFWLALLLSKIRRLERRSAEAIARPHGRERKASACGTARSSSRFGCGRRPDDRPPTYEKRGETEDERKG